MFRFKHNCCKLVSIMLSCLVAMINFLNLASNCVVQGSHCGVTGLLRYSEAFPKVTPQVSLTLLTSWNIIESRPILFTKRCTLFSLTCLVSGRGNA